MTAAQTLAQMQKWKVPYREWSGWQTRGRDPEHGPFSDVHGIIIHHTGSDSGQSDDYLDFLARRGRDDLPGPLCNVSTDMDGDLWLIAQGRANHAGKGSSAVLSKVRAESHSGFTSELTAGPDNTDGNAVFYGNEVRYDGGQPMAPKQYASAVRWAAAVCDFHGWSALSIIGHREWTRRKPDPGNCPMDKFRRDVAALLKAGPGGVKPPASKPTIPSLPEVLQMELNDVVIAATPAKPATGTTPAVPARPAVTVRAVLAEQHWLAQQFSATGQFEDQLDRLEDTLARIEDTDDGGEPPKAS
jgi:hypothetical protein